MLSFISLELVAWPDLLWILILLPSLLKILSSYTIQEWIRGDFPGGPVVKNLPSNAGDAGSIPGQGTNIPHAAGQLSPHATTREPTRSGACTPQLLSLHTLEPACHN